jgi:hypothetical protein
VPSPTVDAVRTIGIPTISVKDLEDGNRDDVETGVMGTVDRAPSAGGYVEFDVTMEVTGAGAAYSASVVPPVDPFLRAGGLGRTLTATPGSETYLYTTLDANFETVTCYAYSAGQLIKAVGCVFKPKMTFEVNKRVFLSGTVTGKLAASPTAASVPTHSFPSVIPPIFSGGTQNIGAWTSADADPLRIVKVDLDFGTLMSDLPAAGAGDGLVGFTITDRKVTQSMDIGVPALATFDPYTLRRATGTALPTTAYGAGSVQYNTIVVSTGRWQLAPATRGNRNLISMYSLSGRLQIGAAPTTGRELNLLFG